MIFKSNFVQPESFEYISKFSLSEFLPVSHLHFLHLWWYGIHETRTVTAGVLKILPDLFLFIISSWVSNRGEWDPVCSEDIVRVCTLQNVHNNITLVRLSWYDLVNFWINIFQAPRIYHWEFWPKLFIKNDFWKKKQQGKIFSNFVYKLQFLALAHG